MTLVGFISEIYVSVRKSMGYQARYILYLFRSGGTIYSQQLRKYQHLLSIGFKEEKVQEVTLKIRSSAFLNPKHDLGIDNAA